MPPKYHISAAEVPNRFRAITRSGVIAWEEGCLKCSRCVKKECIYQVYQKRDLDSGQMLDSLDSACQDCYRCVQNCPNKLIHKSLNPLYKALGDKYWTPEIISNIWYQAQTGRIPVSGAGYEGPFSGPGFDSMWTDMSEIVRPTRDGIHGREYISTTVDIGRKLMALEFNEQDEMVSSPPPLIELPVPVMFNLLPWSPPGNGIKLALLNTAKNIGTFAIIRQSELIPEMDEYVSGIALFIDGNPADLGKEFINGIRVCEIPDSENAISIQKQLKEKNPGIICIINMKLSSAALERSVELINHGAEALHLVADEFGMEYDKNPLFIKDRMKQVHLNLVEKGLRDQVTLLGSGGVAMAEHMAKLIICGADALAVDIPLLVAMECRVCRRCKEGIPCPVELETVDPKWGSSRIKNLMAGWYNQLLEVMGAMGIRDARRLRGEMGRAMFFEDIDKETFAGFGKRG